MNLNMKLGYKYIKICLQLFSNGCSNLGFSLRLIGEESVELLKKWSGKECELGSRSKENGGGKLKLDMSRYGKCKKSR